MCEDEGRPTLCPVCRGVCEARAGMLTQDVGDYLATVNEDEDEDEERELWEEEVRVSQAAAARSRSRRSYNSL